MSQHYTEEFKASMIKKMLGSTRQSVSTLSKESGVSESALYRWRLTYQKQGHGVPEKSKSSAGWSAANKLATVIETAVMNEAALSEYCRKKGLYPVQVKAWKEAALSGYAHVTQADKANSSQRREDQKTIKTLKRELRGKEKALAETAALLVLSKKWQAIWVDNEAS